MSEREQSGGGGAATNVPRPPASYDAEKVARGVIQCVQDVSTELGTGRPLDEYENALAGRLQDVKLKFAWQYPFGVPFHGPADRGFYADFVVEGWVLLELKAVDRLTDEQAAQARDYLQESGCRLCLLINFGQPQVEIRRFVPPDDVTHAQ